MTMSEHLLMTCYSLTFAFNADKSDKGGVYRFKLNQTVNLMGWGSQNDTNHTQPSTQPMRLLTKTIQCPEAFSNQVETRWASYPLFICVSAPTNGGPCEGDDGGKPQIIIAIYCHSFLQHAINKSLL